MWTPKTERCAFLVDNLDLPEAAQFEDARWEHFQLEHLQDDSQFRIENKSRQIAWSWLVAAEAVADAILNGVGTIFQSINLGEAQEKIRYAHNVRYALPSSMRLKLITDNKQELEFDNGARLISLPGNPQRGKAQMNVVFDEFAHIQKDAAVYTAALPVATKGNRRIRAGSSPMGASGRFWEIFTEQLRPYPGYRRKRTPWWEVQAFCKNVREARHLAPALETSQRVDLFGNDRIKALYANMPEEDFQQEYECKFVDESTAWITWDEIKANQQAHSGHIIMAAGKNDAIDQALAAIDQLAELVGSGEAEGAFGAGYDVGRTRNTSELYLVGISTLKSYPLRLAITLDNCDFDNQLDVLTKALKKLPILKILIDQNGIGRNLAESVMKRYPTKAEGVDFTNTTKKLWATEGKMLFQQRRAPIPVDRALAYQIHSIKRQITAAKNMVFDTEKNEKHHADKFWALMLALTAAKTTPRRAGTFASGKSKGWQPKA